MLTSHPIDIPLPVIWSPPGPFNIEIDDLGMGFDSVALVPDLLTAARKASRILRTDWQIGRDSRRIRLESREGEW